RLTAALIRRFGLQQLPTIENAVQDAGLRAVERWRDESSDANFEGWLLRVAHNRVVDILRSERKFVPLEGHEAERLDLPTAEVDDELRLVFLCCHPALTRAAQIALTLRVAFGFETEQIARAFLSDERSIAQRIVRAKQRLREAHVQFDIPGADEIPGRLDATLDVLYQLFTEGYATTSGESGIDDEICSDSLRLVRLLTDDLKWATPNGEALRALFCFHVARAAARRAGDGSLALLHEQDRSKWDAHVLTEAFQCLCRSARGTTMSRFH